MTSLFVQKKAADPWTPESFSLQVSGHEQTVQDFGPIDCRVQVRATSRLPLPARAGTAREVRGGRTP